MFATLRHLFADLSAAETLVWTALAVLWSAGTGAGAATLACPHRNPRRYRRGHHRAGASRPAARPTATTALSPAVQPGRRLCDCTLTAAALPPLTVQECGLAEDPWATTIRLPRLVRVPVSPGYALAR